MTRETLLLRQIHPSWVQSGRVTSQAFKPTAKDDGQLSVHDGDQLTAEESWRHYTKELGYASAGVLAVTVGECERIALTADPDPAPFPAHAVIRFGNCSRAEIERKAKQLKHAAVARDWQYLASA